MRKASNLSRSTRASTANYVAPWELMKKIDPTADQPSEGQLSWAKSCWRPKGRLADGGRLRRREAMSRPKLPNRPPCRVPNILDLLPRMG